MALMRVYCGLAATHPASTDGSAEQWLTVSVVDDAGRLLDVCDIADDPTGYAQLGALLAERSGGANTVAVAADSDEHQVTMLIAAAGGLLAIVDEELLADYAERFADDESPDEIAAGPAERNAVGLARALQAGALAAESRGAARELVVLKPVLAAHASVAAGRHSTAVALREVLRELYPAALRAYPDPAEPIPLAILDALPEPGLVGAAAANHSRDAKVAMDLAASGLADAGTINDAITALRLAVSETPRRTGIGKGYTTAVTETIRQAVAAVRACDAATVALVGLLIDKMPQPRVHTPLRGLTGRDDTETAQSQPRRAQPARVEPTRAAGPPRAELPRTEPPRAEPPRAEPPRIEPARSEPAAEVAQDASRTDGGRAARRRAASIQPVSPAPSRTTPPRSSRTSRPTAMNGSAMPGVAAADAGGFGSSGDDAFGGMASRSADRSRSLPTGPDQPLNGRPQDATPSAPPAQPPSVMPPMPQMPPINSAYTSQAPETDRRGSDFGSGGFPAVPSYPESTGYDAPYEQQRGYDALPRSQRGRGLQRPEEVAAASDGPLRGRPEPEAPQQSFQLSQPAAAHAQPPAWDSPSVYGSFAPDSGYASGNQAPTAPDDVNGFHHDEDRFETAYPLSPDVPAPGNRDSWPINPPDFDDDAARVDSIPRQREGRVAPPWITDLDEPEPPSLRLVDPDPAPTGGSHLRLITRSDTPATAERNGSPRPAAEANADEPDDDLLIFAQMASAWFTGPAEDTDEAAWSDPAADDGWSAALRASEPSYGEETSVGLPRRVPQANLVPGSPLPPAPERALRIVRDPASIAAHTTGYFRGSRRGEEVRGYAVGGRPGRESAGGWDFSRDNWESDRDTAFRSAARR